MYARKFEWNEWTNVLVKLLNVQNLTFTLFPGFCIFRDDTKKAEQDLSSIFRGR